MRQTDLYRAEGLLTIAAIVAKELDLTIFPSTCHSFDGKPVAAP